MFDALPPAAAAPVLPWTNSQTLITLSREAGSQAAATLTAAIADEIEPLMGHARTIGVGKRRTHRAITAAVLAGLLKAGLRGEDIRAPTGREGPLWKARLAGAAKPPVGIRPFLATVDALVRAGLIERRPGISFVTPEGFGGKPTQMRCTPALLLRAGLAGLTAEAFATDWPLSAYGQRIRPAVWGDAVRCMEIPMPGRKAERRGAFPADQDIRVASITAHLDRLNGHLATASVTGCVPPVLVRKFLSDTRLGGRFYAIGSDPYQTMRGPDRRRLLRIDGAPVVEVDLRASVLSILLATAGQDIPSDPYAAGPLAAIDREAAKAFFVQMLFGGRIPEKWSKDHAAAVTATPISRVRGAMFQAYPLLRTATGLLPADLANKLTASGREDLGWGLGQWLVGIEAEILETALGELMNRGVVALPVHDALLCREEDAEEARRSLVESFRGRVGAIPQVSVKNACSES